MSDSGFYLPPVNDRFHSVLLFFAYLCKDRSLKCFLWIRVCFSPAALEIIKSQIMVHYTKISICLQLRVYVSQIPSVLFLPHERVNSLCAVHFYYSSISGNIKSSSSADAK